MKNRAKELLLKLNLVSEDTIEQFYPYVRDRKDVSVLRDAGSGIIFLNRTDHIDESYYEQLPSGSYWNGKNRDEALKNYQGDNEHRATQFASLFVHKDVVDIACGTGGFLDLIKPKSKSVTGVELQEQMRAELTALGYPMYRIAKDLPGSSFDVATLFYALEHMLDPIATLSDIRKALRPGGVLIVEVPHARDALLELESFKKFSLWSEHLILHTKESLRAFLKEAGFIDIEVTGYQRYPLANHLGWIATGAPDGQNKFPQLLDEQLDLKYKQLLMEHDRTDTLIAIAHT